MFPTQVKVVYAVGTDKAFKTRFLFLDVFKVLSSPKCLWKM